MERGREKEKITLFHIDRVDTQSCNMKRGHPRHICSTRENDVRILCTEREKERRKNRHTQLSAYYKTYMTFEQSNNNNNKNRNDAIKQVNIFTVQSTKCIEKPFHP